MKQRTWTDQELIEAVQHCTSRRQVLVRLNLAPQGGNYATIKQAIERLNLDISHFTGQAWNKGKKCGSKRSLFVYLENKHPIKSHPLKLRLLKEGLFKPKCSKCNLFSWNGLPIPLELEHKNGNRLDNSLPNLCLLCPNCHAQTPTYRRRKS